ncbi:MAG: SIS domain-containing protein [Spirochaetota bacterium]
MQTALTRLLELSEEQKQQKGLQYTPGEIGGQVELWEDTIVRFREAAPEIRSLLKSLLEKKNKTCILAGAGTSEYIGYCLEGLWRKRLQVPVNVVSTTRLVTTPHHFIIPPYHTLLVSFARSGNSPESVGAVKIADMVSDNIYNFTVTCNREGALLKEASGHKKSFCFCLDQKTNDQGLAMTASFSNMVVAGQMAACILELDKLMGRAEMMVQGGRSMLELAPDVALEISSLDFCRAVFLGDGANFGTAVESHLKLQELTSGKVMCACNTFAGLRHGPEAVIDEHTLVVAYISTDRFARKYQQDLLEEIATKGIGKGVVACGADLDRNIKALARYCIDFDSHTRLDLPDELTPPINVIAGQLLGVFKSINLNLKPDAPSESGVIHRVVEGVKVYNPSAFYSTGKLEVVAER